MIFPYFKGLRGCCERIFGCFGGIVDVLSHGLEAARVGWQRVGGAAVPDRSGMSSLVLAMTGHLFTALFFFVVCSSWRPALRRSIHGNFNGILGSLRSLLAVWQRSWCRLAVKQPWPLALFANFVIAL